jgi:hypothetical protein
MTVLGLRASGRLGLSPRGRRATAPAFSPPRLPTLAFWYDATDGLYENGTWHDLSGNHNHATQANAAQRPSQTLDQAGRQVVRFDGTNDALLVAAPPDLSAGLTLFVVYRVRTPADFHGIVTASAATGTDHQQFFTLQYEQAANRRVQVFGRSVQANQVVVRGVDSSEIQYAIVTFDDDGVDVELRDLNGIAGDTSTAAPFGTPAVIVLGARYNQGATFSSGAIDLYEVGLYARELGPSERDQLEAYVQRRRGLSWNPRFFGTDLAWFHDADASGFVESGGQVDQWNDLSANARHWITTGSGRPAKTIDGAGRSVVRFDGIDDLLALSGTAPALQPFSIGIVYRMRARGDFTGVLSAAPAAGADHVDFWTFRNASAASLELELFGRSNESDELRLATPDDGAIQTTVWSVQGGVAQLRDAAGAISDTYGGAFGTPDEIVLGGRYGGAPYGFAAVDVFATVGVKKALSATEQQRLIAWAAGRWGL